MDPAPNRIRRLRGGHTLDELAAAAGVSPMMLSYVERGGRMGTARFRHQVVAGLRRLTGDQFLRYEDCFPAAQEAAFHGWGEPARGAGVGS